MTITFYTFNGHIDEMPKELNDGVTLSGSLRGECSILTPTIDVEGLAPAASYNYAYIPEFRRYYAVTGKTVINEAIMRYEFEVDVLQTYAENILNTYAMIERNEMYTNANFEIEDKNFVILPKRNITTIIATANKAFVPAQSDPDGPSYLIHTAGTKV